MCLASEDLSLLKYVCMFDARLKTGCLRGQMDSVGNRQCKSRAYYFSVQAVYSLVWSYQDLTV